MGFLRDELLQPSRVAEAARKVNQKLEERARAGRSSARSRSLRSEIAKLEREISRLVEALAGGRAYEAISGALAVRETRLAEAQAELESLEANAPDQSFQPWTAEDVAARLHRIWDDLGDLDPDKVRATLDRVFAGITLKPLQDDWSKGWALEMEARPWAIMLPSKVVPKVGSGGPL
jgi:hypothetical protein